MTLRVRLTHPAPDFYVDVDLLPRDGVWIALADLGGDGAELGVGVTSTEAVRQALDRLGEPFAPDLAAAATVATAVQRAVDSAWLSGQLPDEEGRAV